MRGKLLLRCLYSSEIKKGWDNDLPLAEKVLWSHWFQLLLAGAEIVLPRLTRPLGASGRPRLVGFSDASEVGLCAVVYVMWGLAMEESVSIILVAKCCVAALHGMTVPCGELQAIVVVHRLLVSVLEAYPYLAESISVFTDSLCSIGALDKRSGSLRPFFTNRVSEISRLQDQLSSQTLLLSPVEHVPGEENPADIGMRGAAGPDDFGPSSIWQQGPGFLTQPFDQWPRSLLQRGGEVPPEECKEPELVHTFQVGGSGGDMGPVAVCVEINNCTNEEGKWNCVCTFNMGGRKFEKKSILLELGKNERKKYFAIYNRKICQGN